MGSWRENIWFVGAAVWLLVGALAVHHGGRNRALASLVIAILFLAQGMFFSKFGKPPRR